jgi:hypothetical protein
MNERTSFRIQQWLGSIKNTHGIIKQAKYRQKRKLGISNNAINISESQLNLSESVQDHLINLYSISPQTTINQSDNQSKKNQFFQME